MLLINGLGIANRFLVQGSAVTNWRTRYESFPKPVYQPFVIGIPLWDIKEIDQWHMEQFGTANQKAGN